jgi:hypothetical protein
MALSSGHCPPSAVRKLREEEGFGRSRSVTRFRRRAWGRASADLAGERGRTTRGARLTPFAKTDLRAVV